MPRDTVGKVAYDLLQKNESPQSAIDLEREMHKDYVQNIHDAIFRGKQDFSGNFYIVVITKKEPLMKVVIRNYFTPRKSCPTPDYDQTVYRYKRADDLLEFLWVIPSKDTCILLKENALQVAPEEQELLRYVLDFADGTLFKLAKKLNGEKLNSPELEK